MDHIDKVLTNTSFSTKYTKALRVACGLAKKSLNKYYAYTDMSDTYRIAMSEYLHPLTFADASLTSSCLPQCFILLTSSSTSRL